MADDENDSEIGVGEPTEGDNASEAESLLTVETAGADEHSERPQLHDREPPDMEQFGMLLLVDNNESPSLEEQQYEYVQQSRILCMPFFAC